MKIVTFNIRCCDDKDGHTVAQRAPRLKAVLDACDADIIGFQEVFPLWMAELEVNYSDKYHIFNKYRSLKQKEAVTILWKKDAFTCIDSGHFWLSDMPWIETECYDKYRYRRICQWAVLEDKTTGARFNYLNTHFGFGDDCQVASARLINRTMAVLGDEKVIVTGDFNMEIGSPAYEEMTATLTDACEVVDGYRGPTYHGYGRAAGHIDYAFVGSGVQVNGFRLLDETFDGKYPSDHYGLLFDLTV